MVELGAFLLIASLGTSLSAILTSLLSLIKKKEEYLLISKKICYLHFYVLLGAVIVLLALLNQPDLSVVYVAEHVNHALPTFYRLTSIWAGQAGSLLWWNFLLVLFSVLSIRSISKKEPALLPYMILILMGTSLFFTSLANFSSDSDPFRFISSGGNPLPQADGRGLNPLLQHWAMIIHPPILYFGYVSFAIPYSIAMGALIAGKVNLNWTRLVRMWTIFSWFFLGAGMLLGGKWAYEELGWGGYWAWDPVENAALMPWFSGTAFLHSILVQEKRGMLKVWNMVLVSLSFIMCIFGTFLTRSGIVTSVHAFASSDLGIFFVIFILIIFVFSTFWILKRLPILKSDRPFHSFLSKEAGFLFNNFILLLCLFTVIWGTMYPTFTETFFNERISITSVWFNKWMVPLGLILLFLTGSGPLLSWRKTSKEALIRNFKIPALTFFCIFTTYTIWRLLTDFNPYSLPFVENKASFLKKLIDPEHFKAYSGLAFAIAGFVFTGILEEFVKTAKNRIEYTKENFLKGFIFTLFQNKRRYLGYMVHLSMALLYIGFAGKSFTKETKLVLRAGEAEFFGGYLIEVSNFENLRYPPSAEKTPLYFTEKATISIYKKNKLWGKDSTEIRTYPMYNFQSGKYDDSQNTSEPAIISSIFNDVYIQHGGKEEETGRLILQVWINPLVFWVWFGFYFFVGMTLLLLLPIGIRKDDPSKLGIR